jgi:DNA-directed RNA polymerase subunit RPC12/RpoP
MAGLLEDLEGKYDPGKMACPVCGSRNFDYLLDYCTDCWNTLLELDN